VGALDHFDVRALRREYGLTQFVETGTGFGVSAFHATQAGFAHVYTVECDQPTAAAARRKLAGTNAVVLEGYSVDVLKDLRHTMAPVPTLWWLDAHFPGSAISGRITVGDSGPEIMPLEREVRLLGKLPGIARDVILIDDLRLYERHAFAHGDMGPAWQLRGIGFIEEAFGATHTIARDLADEGYLICIPRGGSNGQAVSS